jgi:hypothetical protein
MVLDSLKGLEGEIPSNVELV